MSTSLSPEWIIESSITPSEYDSFVYIITNTTNGRSYIGKKTLWSRHKGKSTVESDWKSYWGSSKDLLADIALLGSDKFQRKVLYWCYTKNDSAYLEAFEQFQRNVLGATLPDGSKAYYNLNILSKFFQAPGVKTERAPLKVARPKKVKKKPEIGIRVKKRIWKHTGTQKAIAAEFELSIGQVSKIQKEKP